MSHFARILLLLAVLPAPACLSTGGGGGQPGGDAGWEEDSGEPDAGPDAGLPGFDDHTLGGFSSVEALLEALVEAPGRGQVKFVLPFFQSDQARMARFLDGTVYSMHDEWYWLRLLNGVAVPGVDDRPVQGLDLPTPEDALGWAREQDELPLDLRWVGDGSSSWSTRTGSPTPRSCASSARWRPSCRRRSPPSCTG